MATNLGGLSSNLAELADWRRFWERGTSYLKTAKGMNSKRQRFSTSIVYNMLAMSVEGFFMGYFMSQGGLPENHTLRDLVDYSRQYLSLPDEVSKGLLSMDHFQEICSLEAYHVVDPSWENIETFIPWVETLKQTLEPLLPKQL